MSHSFNWNNPVDVASLREAYSFGADHEFLSSMRSALFALNATVHAQAGEIAALKEEVHRLKEELHRLKAPASANTPPTNAV
jgi:hypothetical protein